MTVKERFKGVIEVFKKYHPDASTELAYGSPYELLVAVILSAQCTDVRINKVTPALFQRYPSVQDLAAANVDEVFSFIKSVSYPNNKAKHLVGMAKMLVADFNNLVPSDIDELQKLPGVGRKTANVIASVVFNKPAMAVDTHVFRVSRRLGLASVRAKTPLMVERQLMKYIPKDDLAKAHHWLILHGRYVCKARKPQCKDCRLAAYCKYFDQNS